MAVTAQQSSGFVDPYNYEMPVGTDNYSIPGLQHGGLLSKAGQLLGFGSEDLYDRQITAQNQAYERASIESARAWSEYMDNTATQRRVKDIEAAGLNPWLAVQNGIGGSGAPSVDTGGTAQNPRSSGQSGSFLKSLMLVIAGLVMKNPKAASAGAASLAKVGSAWDNMSKQDLRRLINGAVRRL